MGQLFTLEASAQSDAGKKISAVSNVGSFRHVRSMSLARVPAQYTTDLEASRRYTKDSADVAMEWVGMLSSGRNFLEQLTVLMLTQNPEIANVCVASILNAKRLTPEATASIQDFAGIYDNQMAKISRGLFFYTGIRFFASKGSMANLKQSYIESEYRSIQYRMVALQRKVSTGKKTVQRDTMVLVITV